MDVMQDTEVGQRIMGMPVENGVEEHRAGPDFALLTRDRMPDRGPRYLETPLDPFAADAPFPAEPWNTVTASFFIVIVFFWAWRLRGRYWQFPFLTLCMPVLLVGGIGGTLYHGLRTSSLFFFLDVIPISLLGLAGSVYLAVKVWHGRGWWYIVFSVLAYGIFTWFITVIIQPLPFWARNSINGNTIAVNANYASLAIVVLIPLLGVLLKMRFRHVGWVIAGLLSFGMAWFFRLVDRAIGLQLPMGSHWLWHTFGAIATALLIEFFYRVEREKI